MPCCEVLPDASGSIKALSRLYYCSVKALFRLYQSAVKALIKPCLRGTARRVRRRKLVSLAAEGQVGYEGADVTVRYAALLLMR
jgi:hypothetical protein